jgi:hypothetical protein
MFAEARGSKKMDLSAPGEQLAARKAELMANMKMVTNSTCPSETPLFLLQPIASERWKNAERSKWRVRPMRTYAAVPCSFIDGWKSVAIALSLRVRLSGYVAIAIPET